MKERTWANVVKSIISDAAMIAIGFYIFLDLISKG